MNTAMVWGVYGAIIVVAVAVTSCIKLIVKKCNGGEVGTAWEYVLSVISLALAGGGAVAWLYYYAGFAWADISVLASLAGTATYIVYLLLFQSTRKAGLALLARIATKREEKKEEEETQSEAVEEVDTDFYDKIINSK